MEMMRWMELTWRFSSLPQGWLYLPASFVEFLSLPRQILGKMIKIVQKRISYLSQVLRKQR
jgi:hypothetical protein